MAIDQLYIVNMALLTIGAKKLSALNDASKAARLGNQVYEQARNEIFDMPINWMFATARTQLSELATEPDFGWDHQFVIANGCRRVQAMVDELRGDILQYEWDRGVAVVSSVQYDVILTNQTTCRIVYTLLREDPSKWPAWFVKAVYLNIAWILCDPLKQDNATRQIISQALFTAIESALDGNGADFGRVDEDNISRDRGSDSVVLAAAYTRAVDRRFEAT